MEIKTELKRNSTVEKYSASTKTKSEKVAEKIGKVPEIKVEPAFNINTENPFNAANEIKRTFYNEENHKNYGQGARIDEIYPSLNKYQGENRTSSQMSNAQQHKYYTNVNQLSKSSSMHNLE